MLKMWLRVRRRNGGSGGTMKCKQCGYPLTVEYGNVAYCPLCRVKRARPCPEIDKETGEWEGMY
jgi:uncharacterized Zn finger protein (UPF0148 family)